jgi:hypothetical protein
MLGYGGMAVAHDYSFRFQCSFMFVAVTVQFGVE